MHTTLPNELQKLICTFLSEHRDGQSDLAPVIGDDIVTLTKIIDTLMSLKFERSCDGDLPLGVRLINKHTHYTAPSVHIPRTTHNASCIPELRKLSNLSSWTQNQLSSIIDNLESSKLKE